MLKRLLSLDYLVPIILIAGVSQYGIVAYKAIFSGSVALWTMDSSELTSSGLLRYVKDMVIVVIAVAWLVVLPALNLPRELFRLINIYFIWLGSVICIGIVGYVLDFSPVFFLPAGLRWLLLLHAAFGVFILSAISIIHSKRHVFIFKFILAILFIDSYAIVLQFKSTADLMGIAFGASRLTGLFSNAGVAATFAIAIALILNQLDGIGLKNRIFATIVCLILALSSGTRYATGAIFIIILSQLWELMGYSRGGRKVRIFIFVPLAFLSIIIGYQALIFIVDRGDAISQQFGSGGRVGNFLDSVEMLYDSQVLEFLFGRGIGIGTNTAIGALHIEGIDPLKYRYNILVDNSFLTGFFQFGMIGSLIFWIGMYRFFKFVKPKYSSKAKSLYVVVGLVILMVLFLGNPFEQYFLMMSFANVLGSCYLLERRVQARTGALTKRKRETEYV